MHINATVLNEHQPVLMPMLDLKPQTMQVPISWQHFDLQTLCDKFQFETGKGIDLATHELAQVNENGTEDFVFSRPGAYRIMLKRIMQAGGVAGGILHLRIQKRITENQQAEGREGQDSEHIGTRLRIVEDTNGYSDRRLEEVVLESERIKIEKELLTPLG